MNPKCFILRAVFFRRGLGGGRNLLEIKHYLQKSRNWEKRKMLSNYPYCLGTQRYRKLLYYLLQKAKKRVTWCGILWLRGQGKEMEIPVIPMEKWRKARGTAKRCFNPCLKLKFLSEAKQDNIHWVACWYCIAEASANSTSWWD